MSLLAASFLPLALLFLLLPLWPLLSRWRAGVAVAGERIWPIGAAWDAPARASLQRVQESFSDLLQHAERDGLIRGAREDGTLFMILGPHDYLSEHLQISTRRLRTQLLAVGHLDIPGELICDRLVYAQARLNIAHNVVLRTALAGRDAVIGPRARVRQWIHAGNRLDVAEGAILAGCASAGQEIVLARRARFERLLSARIRFGHSFGQRRPAAPLRCLEMQLPAHARQMSDGRWLVDGDLSIPPARQLKARLIVNGSLLVGTGSQLRGELHVMGELVVHHDAYIHGAIQCDAEMRVGECCLLAGPIRCAGSLSLGSQTIVGTPNRPSTIIASQLQVHEGCIVHGAIHATQRGEVCAESART